MALKHLAQVTYGLGQPPPSASSGIPILRATNIYRGRIHSEGLVYAALHDLPLERAPLLRAGEILVVRSGAYTGDSALVTEDWQGSAPGYDLRLTPHADTEPRFLAYQLLASHVLHQIELVRSRAAQPHLNAEELGAIEVCCPRPKDQHAIADFLDGETARIDAVVDKKRQLLEILAERRRAVMFRGVVGSLAPGVEVHDPGLPWAQEIRGPWPTVKIKYVARLGTGHTPSRAHPEFWENCTIPWITTGEIKQVRDDRAEVISETQENISKQGLANSAAELHEERTVVLCRTASAGYSAIMGADMATSQDFATWTCSNRLLPRYLLMCLRAMRDDLQGRLAFGSTHKTIYMPDIEDLKLPLPSVEEQREVLADIDSLLVTIDALTDRLSRQLALLAEHRQALITAAVAGSIALAGTAA
ncbi:MAG: restriction endonuclease subunit S [Actinomycetota bacterium]